MKEFRLLNPDEIEVRVSHTSKNFKRAMLLLYKDARCDMKILDETLGITGWQRSHEVINGQLFCNVSIYDEDKKEWIKKQDVGVESFSEAEKGRASDAFKRACFNVGIGRELYTAPIIWVEDISGTNTKSAWKWKKYRVKEVGYDENRKIDSLVIEEYFKYKWQEVFRFPTISYSNKNHQKNNYKKVNQDKDYWALAHHERVPGGKYKDLTYVEVEKENPAMINHWYDKAKNNQEIELMKIMEAVINSRGIENELSLFNQ